MIKWTNKSVIEFSKGYDPIRLIEEKAKEIVFAAMEEGWSGPPYDPLKLAELLKIPVVARSDIPDARTVPHKKGVVIEFNPNKPRGRLRYSLAHEIAHTFFPDCSEQIRNRGEHLGAEADEWQLELLCNIAAAELIMPIGSLNNLRDEEVSIDHILELRKRYDVSTEAMLLRIGKITSSICGAFCASPINSGKNKGRYRVEYLFSPTKEFDSLKSGTVLPEGSAVYECTAIGYTAKSRLPEKWDAFPKEVVTECVGLPPYPGSFQPRVAGIVRLKENHSRHLPPIEYLVGNALEPRGDGLKIIAHIVNDRTPNWGGRSFASSLAKAFPEAQTNFRHWVSEFKNEFKLGNIHTTRIDDNLIIADLIAQHGLGASTAPRLRYQALEECLKRLAEFAIANNASIHMPRIGAGNAGGKWEVIEEYILSEISNRGISVTVYDLYRTYETLQDSLFSVA